MRRFVLPMRNHAGVTLIEMMVVVGLVAILGAIALPNFRDMMNNQRLAARTRDFVAALTFARAEAMKNSQTVIVRPRVSSSGWDSGWVVQTGSGDDIKTLRAFDALGDGVAVDQTLGNRLRNAIRYDGSGFSRPASGSGFESGCTAFKSETGRRSAVVVGASGRPRTCDPDKSADCGPKASCDAASKS